jgi:hypothetical protein
MDYSRHDRRGASGDGNDDDRKAYFSHRSILHFIGGDLDSMFLPPTPRG